MRAQTRRDAGFTALFLGFFASAWFGWAQAGGESGWLTAGSIFSVVVAAIGLVTGLRAPGEGSAMRDRTASRRYGIIVGIEFAVIFAGAALLGGLGQEDYIPVWVAFVVGVHFVPLAPVLGDPLLRPLAVATCLVALAGLITGLASAVSPPLVVGVAEGLLLLGYSVQALARGARRPAQSSV
ncbi:hypothetical protein DFJ67_6274 [Asanoa ferruginea]|uniref:Uncharacterized protein n=1 Tax=Asanoa ferruginea TaxID=53367 RepID=A0A3D9ZUQ7_9ACTN|nr:hypothetical protein [Asanoa ferruginea]REG00223.1 hypothetical protein DFJ67_6274 [Asanoa ferruginea]GIF46078.1 hypothetical protein Afe04nite_06170 [Asanoa ferruginea]